MLATVNRRMPGRGVTRRSLTASGSAWQDAERPDRAVTFVAVGEGWCRATVRTGGRREEFALRDVSDARMFLGLL